MHTKQCKVKYDKTGKLKQHIVVKPTGKAKSVYEYSVYLIEGDILKDTHVNFPLFHRQNTTMIVAQAEAMMIKMGTVTPAAMAALLGPPLESVPQSTNTG